MTNRTMLARSRAMRTEMSDCERRLWWRLRNRQLAGCKFRRQHPVGPFIADFACIEARLIIEVDGETHGNDEQESREAQRTAWLERHGWRVLRFGPPMSPLSSTGWSSGYGRR